MYLLFFLLILPVFLWISLEDYRSLKIRHSRLLLLAVLVFSASICKEGIYLNGRWGARLFLAALPSLLSEIINGFCFSFAGIGGSDIWLLYLCSFLLGPEYMWEAYLVDLLIFLGCFLLVGKRRMAMGPALCVGTVSTILFSQFL